MKTRTLTILQADLVGSTTTVASVSRQEMAEYIEEACAQISHAIRYYGGDPFKFTGDGYLASFESASDCFLAAQKIQRDMQTRNLMVAGKSVGALRIIIHTADVIVTEDDLLGDGVATVSRLEKMTPPGAIYVTETARGVCKRAEFDFEFVDTYALRGVPDPIRVYELKHRDRLIVEQDVCILVSDIKQFSRLTNTVVPEQLEEYLVELHRLHREAAREFSGALAKIMGDKVLMTFHQADEAVSAALALTEGAATYCRQKPDLPEIKFTLGIACGDVYRFSGDMYGAAVNEAFLLAARLDEYAIAMTEKIYERLTIDRSLFTLIGDTLPEWPDCPLKLYASLRGSVTDRPADVKKAESPA